MSRKTWQILLLAFGIVLTGGQLWGQVTYTMRDTLVTDCKGTLTDSDNGNIPGYYGLNEDYTFTICPDSSVQSITINFISFITEANFDVLRIFDGPDTNSTLIGTYSGAAFPPQIVSNGCITFHFQSDGNIAFSGWELNWTTQIAPPVPATMNLNPALPTCSTSAITVQFNQNFLCDSVDAGHFSLTGQLGQSIAVNGVGCNNPGDSSNTYTLNLAPGLDQSGWYYLTYTYYFLDPCDSVWTLTVSDSLEVNDCPMSLQLILTPDTICPGDCAQLQAVVTGGDPNSYNFAWSNGLPNGPGPFTVCPNATTTYTLTVTDASPSPAVSGSITLVVAPPPTVQATATLCEADPPITLTGSPSGGVWFGLGVADSIAGVFDPDSTGPGTWPTWYRGPNGCSDTVQVTVLPGNAGPDEAACPGTGTFTVSGFSPPGGTWSGAGISAGGQFNPTTPGTYVVTYTAPNGCTDTKNINVANLVVQPDDTTCRSLNSYTLNGTPFGGVWTGPGLVNQYTGEIDPGNANIGLNQYIYALSGCQDTVNLYIQNINAGNNQTVCPKQPNFTVIAGQPVGGYWTGPGILDSLTGLFNTDHSNGNNFNALLTYHFAGCTDEKYVYIRNTTIQTDSLQFCRQDSQIFRLDGNRTGRNPGNGNWTGSTGIIDPNYPGEFVPALAGPGYHTLYYTANTCTDSMTVHILEPKQLTDTTVCQLSAPFQLTALPVEPQPGGAWSGPGITDPHGIFDPMTAGVGTHILYYTSWFGCDDTTQVTVFPPDTITLGGLDPFYCYQDTNISFTALPAGGVLTGNGLNGTVFNPSLAGPGVHQITYTLGNGDCQTEETLFVTVGQPLSVLATASDTAICQGDFVTLNAGAAGGNGSPISLNWNQGLGSSFQIQVQPLVTTTYIVTATDSCSDTVSDTVTVVVQQPFTLSFDTSSVKCYGDSGYAVVRTSIPGNFSYEWNTNPPQFTDSIIAPVADDYVVLVTDPNTGCFQQDTIRIPGHPQIRANFILNPSDCAPIENPEITFIDLSVGVASGTWQFGDGTTQAYMANSNPIHVYSEIGTFTVILDVVNSGGCTDMMVQEICIEPEPFHIYNTFTPNGDGKNDEFRIDGIEAYPENKIQIFNRYGNLVFEAAPYQNDWIGKNWKTGANLPDGAYFYVFDKGMEGEEPETGDVVIMR